MSTQHWFWALAGASGFATMVASLAERLRHRRRNLDAVGWMPWTAIQFLGVLITIVAAAVALKS